MKVMLIIGPEYDWVDPDIDQFWEDEEEVPAEWKLNPVYDGWRFRSA